ncbi:hypothetical protein D3C74_449050 [compost metagenome]
MAGCKRYLAKSGLGSYKNGLEVAKIQDVLDNDVLFVGRNNELMNQGGLLCYDRSIFV